MALAAIVIFAAWGMLAVIFMIYGSFIVWITWEIEGPTAGVITFAGAIIFVSSFKMYDEYGLLTSLLVWVLGTVMFLGPLVHMMTGLPEKRLT
ncbi:MAG: hypothetical protein V4690_01615 [Patescibacteria group bacterium]